jgi:hypothetical protein
VAAGQLALCSDLLTTGLLLGLIFDGTYAALSDTGLYQVYLKTAGNLATEFATGKLLKAVAGVALGEAPAEFASNERELANSFHLQILTLESLTQPSVPADFLAPPPQPTETYLGTATYSGNVTSPNLSGWTPDPITQTQVGGPTNAKLQVNGSLLNHSAFSGTLTTDGYAVINTTPAQIGPPDPVTGIRPTIPEIVLSTQAPSASGPISGTGDANSPNFASLKTSSGGVTTTATSSISVAPVTGTVTLTINVQATINTGGISSVQTINYQFTRQ